MKITGSQLIYLFEVLEDSLEIQQGYDWVFKHSMNSRKIFYKNFFKKLFEEENIEISDIDKFMILKK